MREEDVEATPGVELEEKMRHVERVALVVDQSVHESASLLRASLFVAEQPPGDWLPQAPRNPAVVDHLPASKSHQAVGCMVRQQGGMVHRELDSLELGHPCGTCPPIPGVVRCRDMAKGLRRDDLSCECTDGVTRSSRCLAIDERHHARQSGPASHKRFFEGVTEVTPERLGDPARNPRAWVGCPVGELALDKNGVEMLARAVDRGAGVLLRTDRLSPSQQGIDLLSRRSIAERPCRLFLQRIAKLLAILAIRAPQEPALREPLLFGPMRKHERAHALSFRLNRAPGLEAQLEFSIGDALGVKSVDDRLLEIGCWSVFDEGQRIGQRRR